jgi:hypothetical protein
MIVLGSRSLNSVGTAIHGSIGSSVTARARCPVVVVRNALRRRAPVVVGVDGSPASRAAIAYVSRLLLGSVSQALLRPLAVIPEERRP